MEWLLKAFAGTIIESVLKILLGAVRTRRLDRERDAAITGKAVAEARGGALEQQNQVRKDMADAQATSPGDRDTLADQLLRDAEVAEAGPAAAG